MFFGDKMKVPLVVEPEDSKWKFLKEVLKCFDSRRFRQEMSKAKMRPVPKGGFWVFNSLCKKRSSQDTLIINSTDIQIDLNWFRKTIKKKDLEDRDFAWGYSFTKGYYIGHKMTLVVEYPQLRPLYFCLHRGSPNDAKLFLEILEELKRRRILRNGDIIVADR